MNSYIIQQLQASESIFPEQWSKQVRANKLPVYEKCSIKEQIALHKTIVSPLLIFMQNGYNKVSLSSELKQKLQQYCPEIQSLFSSILKNKDEENTLLALKTVLHTLESMINQAEAEEEVKNQALILVNIYFDHLEWSMLCYLKKIQAEQETFAELTKDDSCCSDSSAILDPDHLVENHSHVLEKLFWSLFESTKSGVLLVDKESTIMAANGRCCEIFGSPRGKIKGQKCTLLIAEDMHSILKYTLEEAKANYPSRIELTGKRVDKQLVPLDITVNRVDLDHYALYLLVIRDMSLQRNLQEELKKERGQVEEMSVALKKVIETVEQEQKHLKDELASQIKNELLPAVEKMAKEPSKDVRESYMNLIQDQLTELTAGSSAEIDKHLLRLTPTELQVCRYIQANKSSKEIAELMNSSFETIQTHRKNIRDKLGLKGKNITLFMFLKSKQYSSKNQTEKTNDTV